MSNIRLQKYLAQAGVASRRKAEEFIREGRVSVNGNVVRELGTKVDLDDKIFFDGSLVQQEEKRLYLFHKPEKVITTLSDPEQRPCVGDYLSGLAVKVKPVGRLDFDVSGLLLLTNDGDFAEQLSHPRYQTPRVYQAKLTDKLPRADIKKLLTGVELEDGPAKADRITSIEPQLVEIEVHEGRNHFVKNLFKAVGNPVIKLKRVSFGTYSLGNLKPGQTKQVGFTCAEKS